MRLVLLCFYLAFATVAKAQDSTMRDSFLSPRITLLANGQPDSLIVHGEPFVLTLDTVGASSCRLLSPTEREGGTRARYRITPHHILYHGGYPKRGEQKIFEVRCRNAQDSTAIARITIIRRE